MDEKQPGHPPAGAAETPEQKSARLKAARLQADKDRDLRIERANRKAAARRKILGPAKS